MGWDSRETFAYKVAVHSLLSRSKNAEVFPLKQRELTDIVNRPIEIKDGKMWCPISEAPVATEFAITRFAIPFLQEEGWALFMDCDMVILDDIQKVFDLKHEKYAVMVVKHGKLEAEGLKMDGQIQTTYPKKNWSSFVLWNLDHPSNKKLTIEMLNTLPGRDLHAFCWLNEDEIGELPNEWNYLVDVNPVMENPKNAHYTLGGPWFEGWEPRTSDDIWNVERLNMSLKQK